MSDVAMTPGDHDAATFRPLTVILMLVIGVLTFGATLVLGAYAPDMRPARNGGTHAESTGATGFAGLYRLAEATGRTPRVIRDTAGYDTDDLVILSPPDGTTDVGEALRERGDRPTLMILPKWTTKPDPRVTGWVRAVSRAPNAVPEGVLAPGTKLKVLRVRGGGRLTTATEMYEGKTVATFVAPPVLQTISGANLRPVITDHAGRIVLGELGSRDFYVLADPDLLANMTIDDPAAARAALAMLDYLGPAEPEGVAFDLMLNGLGRRPNPLKLAFEPPFLAMTLTLVAALVLAGLHAFGRFGAAQAGVRAIAFGKTALVDNTAALVRKARREAAMGPRYAAVVRDRARAAFGVPARLTPDAADAVLDGIDRRATFSVLAADLTTADHPHDMLAAAQALHDWQQGRHG